MDPRTDLSPALEDSPPVPAITPVAARERIPSIDVLRGVALFGILIMNIVYFALPGAAYGDPTIAGGSTGADYRTWFACQLLFEGKMRTIFSMLFGAGVALLTSRAEERGAGARIADIYYRRTLWLILFGVLHAYFLWGGDILYGYGVAGLLLYPFRRQSARFLTIAGLLVLALLVPRSILEARHLDRLRAGSEAAAAAVAAGRTPTAEQEEARDELRERLKEMKPSPAEVAREIDDHRAGYVKSFVRRARHVNEGESSGFYNFGLFDVAGMMLLGMGLLKLGLFTAARPPRFYAALVLAGYGLGVPLNWWIAARDAASGFDPMVMYVDYSGYDIGRLLVALGHIGVVMLVCRSGWLASLTSRLAAVGQMALTNYLMHTLICVALFEGYGLGLFGRLHRHQLMYVVVPIWIAQLALSPVWLRRFRFGPMEWLWRSLTYWQRQPMRLASTAGFPAP